ncbi:hypothetical protein B0T16DRAFT_461468 [Cercophora newfieldiana]|uniref:C2H2-type domain-containing protein n=1 Tax=Cercophora newfieldiana TaxID=92897 RepID=A0AA39XW87_9PEZI|nr:hypothetical protein B0T16DRAFT_461468 [Cercophora newfieldiana]
MRKITLDRSPDWPTTHRIKEHLYRCHTVHSCIRCRQTFKSQAALQAHGLLPPAEMCELRPGNPSEGITDAIKLQLKSRKRRPDISEEEKWRGIYTILFPGEEPPSPYHVKETKTVSLESFLRREMRPLVEASVGEAATAAMQPIQEMLLTNLQAIVQANFERAFERFRGLQTIECAGSGVQQLINGTATPLTSESSLAAGQDITSINPRRHMFEPNGINQTDAWLWPPLPIGSRKQSLGSQ